MRVTTNPTPNVRVNHPLDLWELDRQVAGLEPGELGDARRQRTRWEHIEFVAWWAAIGIGLGCFWYVVFVALRALVAEVLR